MLQWYLMVARTMIARWQWLKGKGIAHIETWRPYTVIWCGLLSLTGACLVYGQLPPIDHVALVLSIPIMGWIAGLYLSDYLDIRLDMIQKAHRPIPSGRIHPYEALMFGAMFAGLGLVLTIQLGFQNILLAFVAALLVFSYARITKPRGIFGNINRGGLAVVSFLFGVLSINGSLISIQLPVWLLCLVFLLHDMNTNLVGTLRDMKSDAEGGYRTIPVVYGLNAAISIAITLSGIWFLLAASIMTFYYSASVLIYLFLLIDALLLLMIIRCLRELMRTYSRKKALTIHKCFVLERITLASAFITLIVGIKIGLMIYVSSLVFTILFQILLRNQYEFNKWEL